MNPGHLRAVAQLYQAWFTGSLLFVASRKSAQAAGELSFALFRRQHLEKFLASFTKLGLDDKPPAVACAQYHYLSNSIGGVGVECMVESDRKAWVRFKHPRWMYEGAALAGMPLEVSHGFLNGWYAHNGVSLNHPGLGFVCTSQDMDGQYGLAGYFYDYQRPLSAQERLRFAPEEAPPPFDPGLAPALDSDTWPAERLQKAHRNYAMTYMQSLLPELVRLYGPLEATWLGGGAAEIIGRQYYAQTAQRLAVSEGGPLRFAELMQNVGAACGDRVEVDGSSDQATVRQYGWRLFQGLQTHPAVFDAWNGIWRGMLAAHDRFLVIEVLRRQDYGDDCFEWRIRRRS